MSGHTWNKPLLVLICCQLIPCACLTSAAADVATTKATAQAGGSPVGHPLDEVIVRASKLLELRRQLEKAQDAFFDEYNKFNTVPEYHTRCGDQTDYTTRMPYHECEPHFVTRATENEARGLLRSLQSSGPRPASAALEISVKMPRYRKHVHDVAEKNPGVAKKARDFLALSQRYETISGTKYEGRSFVYQ